MVWRCPFCGKKYKILSGLVKHMLKTHYEFFNKLKCPLCNKEFPRRGLLNHYIMYALKHNDPYHALLAFCYKNNRMRDKTKSRLRQLIDVFKVR